MSRTARFARGRDLLVPAILFLAPAASQAFQLERVAFSGGAGSVSAGSYSLGLTVGEAGVTGFVTGGSYRLSQGFWGSAYRLIATDAPASPIRYSNALFPNSPNPFHDATRIDYSVGHPSAVRLHVYDVTGRRVASLVDETQVPGRYSVPWNGRAEDGAQAATGVYFYRLQIGPWSATDKMLKLR